MVNYSEKEWIVDLWSYVATDISCSRLFNSIYTFSKCLVGVMFSNLFVVELERIVFNVTVDVGMSSYFLKRTVRSCFQCVSDLFPNMVVEFLNYLCFEFFLSWCCFDSDSWQSFFPSRLVR